MNILKHMEAVFVATLALACSTAYIADTMPAAHAQTVAASAPANANLTVVTVSAKRLTPQQKLQSLREERSSGSIASTRGTSASRT